MKLPHDIAVAHPSIQAHYRAMIEDGQTPAWAEMCALQQPPGHSGTDVTYMEGRNNGEWLNDMPKRQADYMLKEAKQAGISTAGKYYCSGIADKRGWCDPHAWVSGRDDVLKVAKKRRLEVRGSVEYTPPEQAPKKSKRLADSIVRDIHRKTGKSRDAIIEKHGPQRKK